MNNHHDDSARMEANSLSLPECRATSYVYQPLDDATQSIRLIRLQPALSFDTDVQCDIYHVTLDTRPIYEALSYAWGDAKVTSPIFLEGCPFQATVNLVSALRHLRHEDKTRTLWVDAICIDQSNIQERGHQVAFMATIYSMAESDILWLGDDPHDDAETAFKFIQNMCHTFNNLPPKGKERTKAVRAAYSVLGEDAPVTPLQRIMNNRPIWKRIWIVQEIVVARKVSIQCGNHSMSWDSLGPFMYLIQNDHSLWQQPGALFFFENVLETIQYAALINTVRISYHEPGHRASILELWSQFYDLLATDPRDKIFALLGLAAPMSLDSNADYTKPAPEIFTMAVRTIIYQTKKLDALCMGHRQPANRALPTWVVDFGSCAYFSFPFWRNPIYLASGNTDVSSDTVIHPALDPAKLVVSGLQLDTILTCHYTTTSNGIQTWLDLRPMIQNLPHDILKHRYHTGESMVVALARTITGDMSFGPFEERQRMQESRSISRDIQSILSWTGRLHDQLGKEGDILSVLYGSNVPHVLRKVPGKEDTYTLVGTAYVHGFMYGEAIQWRDQGKLKGQKFNLI
ncbi:hypothetical protein NA56DRAFT_645560 [Hyaloscypha hepaticicola]|uniref:Heterokaryon incompatibility domain-containing protein n=1 Tax=Hyaloscypha hepaticicola TaxID=2082293 RepID=A0A2J6Q698_9HELO|nr:hypothetical protein NA56DRAFT_645560 [Hyaloscypha hepaticicola]